jgi:hypothetical protein
MINEASPLISSSHEDGDHYSTASVGKDIIRCIFTQYGYIESHVKQCIRDF